MVILCLHQVAYKSNHLDCLTQPHFIRQYSIQMIVVKRYQPPQSTKLIPAIEHNWILDRSQALIVANAKIKLKYQTTLQGLSLLNLLPQLATLKHEWLFIHNLLDTALKRKTWSDLNQLLFYWTKYHFFTFTTLYVVRNLSMSTKKASYTKNRLRKKITWYTNK